MKNELLIALVLFMIVAAIGQYTTEDVRDNIRLRRRNSRRRTSQMAIYEQYRNGKFGVYANLVVE